MERVLLSVLNCSPRLQNTLMGTQKRSKQKLGCVSNIMKQICTKCDGNFGEEGLVEGGQGGKTVLE